MPNDDLEHLFVVLDNQGICRRIIDGGTEHVAGLPSLLKEGWRPVRETSFGEGGLVLLLLDRDPRDPKGFGFRT